MSDEKNTITVDLVANCKADLTALEHAFRAGWAACSADRPFQFGMVTADEAWAAFLAGELKAFET